MKFQFSEGSFTAEAVLFDLDGTLIDSSACVEASWHEWALRHELDPHEVMRSAQGMRTIDSIPVILPGCDLEQEVKDLEDLECAQIDGLVASAGAHQLLERLARQSWAIVTSCSLRLATHRMQYTHLARPEVLVCADHVTSGKPSPEGYLLAASRLGIAPGTGVVVEDSPAGIRAGKAAGMTVIAVVSTHRAGELRGADHVCDSLSDLARALR
jgi:mannitol-1-/sugar-/sorbitol-6-phosphatase